MIITYLENIYSELLENKIQLEQEQTDITSKMNKHLRYMERLKLEDEKNFDAFSPRKQNVDLKNQIEQLETQQHDFLESIEKKKKELLKIDSKIDELNSVLKIAKQQSAANERIFEKSIQEKEILKLKLLETQELERQRIARELHDSSVQCLTGLVHKTELCTKLLELDPPRCRLEMLSMTKSLRSIIEEMRQMIYDLHPMSMDDIGFDDVIEREMYRINQLGIVHADFTKEGKSYQLKPVIALTILRVIREACNNVLKYANATLLFVKLSYEKDKIKILICDDGDGFSLEEQAGEIKDDNSGFGLSTMRERIYLLSGTIEINTEIGKGTRVTVEVPISREE